MDELRDSIWDYIFKEGQPKSLDDIAAFADRDPETIRAVVNHEWFHVAQNEVSIAYETGSRVR